MRKLPLVRGLAEESGDTSHIARPVMVGAKAGAPQTRHTLEAAYALRVSDVGKAYKSGFRLEGVTFDLPMGYIMGLVGPNGAGKSTLIKLILNMVDRDAGSIEVLGQDNIVDEVAVKERLGIVFDASPFPETWRVTTVGKAMGLMYRTWNGERFDWYLQRFGVGKSKRVKELSRGMQMKMMLAAALSHDAKLLILDEPTSGLDVLSRDKLMDILSRYIEDGRHSVMFSTHVTEDLEHCADFITYITEGSLFYTGPKDEFTDAFRVVKGGSTAFQQVDIAGKAVGIRRYATGFDALIRAERVSALVGGLHDAGERLDVEPASIDDIIRMTNMNSGVAAFGSNDTECADTAQGRLL